MQTHIPILLLSLFFILPLLSFARTTPQDLIRSSCAQARYPTLCVQTLSNNVGPTTKPLDLAQAAIKASLTQTLTLSVYFNTLKSNMAVGSTNKNNKKRVAINDCVAQVSDSVDELNQTLNELQHLRMGTFEWQVSNAQTWASTALTNGNLCINGVSRSDAEEKVKLEVKKRVTSVSMFTSNALYLINRLGDSRKGKPRFNNSKN